MVVEVAYWDIWADDGSLQDIRNRMKCILGPYGESSQWVETRSRQTALQARGSAARGMIGSIGSAEGNIQPFKNSIEKFDG